MMYMAAYPPALSSQLFSRGNQQLSLDEMLYDPSQPNKVYTFDGLKQKAQQSGLRVSDADIQKAVTVMNSQNPQQTLESMTPLTTSPALDSQNAQMGVVPNSSSDYKVDFNPETGMPILQPHMFDSRGEMLDEYHQAAFKDPVGVGHSSYSPTIEPALATPPSNSTADPVSQPMLNTQGTAQNEQRLQEMFDGMNVTKEGKTGHTGLARESTSTFHKLAMGGMGEKLMRMGAAMNANAHLGGNVMLGAMGQQAAAFNQEQRANQLLEQQQRANALSAYNESIAEQQASLDVVDDKLRSYQSALEQFDKFDGATGYVGGSVNKFIDNLPFGNAARQAFRLQLQDIAVNETLLKTAQTKGAISDKEMSLFQSPVPSLYAREDVWREWLNARIENMNVIRDRIARGITVSRDAGIGFTNTYNYADDQDAQNYAREQENQTGQNMSPAPQAQQTNSITGRPSALTPAQQNSLIAKNLSN